MKRTLINHAPTGQPFAASAYEQPNPNALKTFELYWSPEGRKIATVQARNVSAAIRKAPAPYRKFLGELYAKEIKS